MAALLLSACSQDELAENSTALPEGEYPLQIGSVTLTAEVSEQPWTRVSENPTDGMSSVWKDRDKIGVRIGDNEETGIYVMNVDAEGRVVGVTPEKAVYWKDKQPATITAWYPVKEELDFTHQDQGLTYLLKGTSNADYNTSANLAFTHQLAKVRVVLEGDKANEVQTVTVRSHLTSPNNQGDLGSLTSTENKYVPMMEATYNGQRCWEANLRPGYLEADNTFEVAKAEGDPVRVTLDDKVTIKAGQVHTITIGVEQAPTEIDLDTYEGTTLAVSGKTTIKGDGTKPKDLQITVEADAEVTLEDVVLAPSATGNAITCKGDATIILTGSSSLTAKTESSNYPHHYGSGIYVESGTLTIDGEGSLIISRTSTNTRNFSVGAGIGAGSGANILIKSGNISISDVPDDSSTSGAGIGSTPLENCGNITIKGGTIRIGKPYWYSACIGSAEYRSCGDITISGESTVITFTKGLHAPWGIGNGDDGTCGTVTITGGATVNGVKYIETHTGTL